jgi:hypothetical protein
MSEVIIDTFKAIAPPIGWTSLGAVLGIFVKHRLDLGKSRILKLEADIKTGKMELMPLFERLLGMARNSGGAIGTARFHAQEELPAPISRFRLHLTGSRLEQFNEAWSAVAGITREQVWNRQPNDSDEQFAKMEQILASRLEALRKVVHDT